MREFRTKSEASQCPTWHLFGRLVSLNIPEHAGEDIGLKTRPTELGSSLGMEILGLTCHLPTHHWPNEVNSRAVAVAKDLFAYSSARGHAGAVRNPAN